jgi:ketosteroid isomerase-like protein
MNARKHALLVIKSRLNGKDSDAWVRSTVCYRKIDGKWALAHEHVSVPYYMETGKAAVDLKPY